MNTDSQPGLAQAINTRLLHKTETAVILGHAFEILNEMGRRFHEKIFLIRVNLCPSVVENV